MSFTPEMDDRLELIVRLVAENREEGLVKLQKVAEEGNRSAILYLGLYLSENEETTDLSVPWLLKASDFDSADAAWNLAMIARGRGELSEMKQWINRAADLGEEDAEKIRNNGYDVERVLAG